MFAEYVAYIRKGFLITRGQNPFFRSVPPCEYTAVHFCGQLPIFMHPYLNMYTRMHCLVREYITIYDADLNRKCN